MEFGAINKETLQYVSPVNAVNKNYLNILIP